MVESPVREKTAVRTPPPSTWLLDQEGKTDNLVKRWTRRERFVALRDNLIINSAPWILLAFSIVLKGYGIENPGPVGDFIQHEGEIGLLASAGMGFVTLRRILKQTK